MRVLESVNRPGNQVVKLAKCAHREQPSSIDEIWMFSQLLQGLGGQGFQEVSEVKRPKASSHMIGAGRKVKRSTDRCGALELCRHTDPLLAQPFEHHGAAKGDAGHQQVDVRALIDESADYQADVTRFSRVIEAPRTVDFAIAGTEHHEVAAPASQPRLIQQAMGVFRRELSFQAMEDEEVLLPGRDSPHASKGDMVAVGCHHSLEPVVHRWSMTSELPPCGGQMRAGKPPSGPELRFQLGHLTAFTLRDLHSIHIWLEIRWYYTRDPAASSCFGSSSSFSGLSVEVQVFGVKKNQDVRKALRFWSERRVKVHFVDFKDRAPSKGELQRFAQRFGISALIDKEAKRYAELGLSVVRYDDARWIRALCDEPLVLRMPLSRFQQQITIGLAEAEWASWIEGMKT